MSSCKDFSFPLTTVLIRMMNSSQVKRTVDAETFEISVNQSVLGIEAPLKDNLKDGLISKSNLYNAKGQTKYHLRNGNEVWTHIDIKITFNGSFDKDVKLLSFQALYSGL